METLETIANEAAHSNSAVEKKPYVMPENRPYKGLVYKGNIAVPGGTSIKYWM